MPRKNFGARNAESKQYAHQTAIDDIKSDVSDCALNLAVSSVNDAQEWAHDRGTAGDNIPTDRLNGLANALAVEDFEAAIKAALDVSGTPMHPTAQDIVGGAARQTVYSLTGKRANNYELE